MLSYEIATQARNDTSTHLIFPMGLPRFARNNISANQILALIILKVIKA